MAKRSVKKKTNRSKKKSTEKPILPYILIGLAIAAIIIVAIEIDAYLTKSALRNVVTTCDFCDNATAPITSKNTFRDYNPLHLEHAQKNGLDKPFETNAEFEHKIDSLVKYGRLVEVTNTRYYIVRDLTHSFAYLTPEAVVLLEDIGVRFQAKLKEHNLPHYRFEISSLLRTKEMQRVLTRVNRNATPNGTAHYYGTTFDIAFHKYERNGDRFEDSEIEDIMKQTLREMRQECRFLIVKESRNKCFHITVVKCKNS
ncbi:MAG TPA: DUF5715 family protein [Paludibacteraceae bacterium]|nr:DUF5715 family protein [Paludibacteraceae bacterium]